MQRRTLTVLLVLLAAVIARAQECWLQPKKFRPALNEEMIVAFLAGDNFDGEPWDLKKNKIVKLELSHLAKLIDLKLQVKPDAKEKLKYNFNNNELKIELPASLRTTLVDVVRVELQ